MYLIYACTDGVCGMLGLWSAGREYAVQDLVVFALTAVVGLVVVLVVFWFWNSQSQPAKSRAKASKDPARWRKEPADKELGDMGDVSAKGSVHEYLDHLHDGGRCPVTSFWWGKEHVVSVCSPQAFKDITKLTDYSGKMFRAFAPLFGNNSIIFSNGTDWAERRKCFNPVFKGEDLQSYFPHFIQIAQELEGVWSRQGTGEKIPLKKTALSVTIQCIAPSIFGEMFKDPTLVEQMTEAYVHARDEIEKRVKEGVDPPEGSERDRELQKNVKFLRDVVKRVISQRREGGGEEYVPFIDNLLQSGVPDEQVIDEAQFFMVAGFDTTAYFIVWLLWYLADHPDVQERILEEVERETGGESGDRLKAYAMKVANAYSTYLRQVEDETLRLSVLSTWTANVSAEDIVVDSCLVPGGTPIIQALGVGMNNPTAWQEGGLEEFNPDRFATHTSHARRGLEFCPFGIPSRRKCPAYIFSHFEITIIISILIRRFQLFRFPNQLVELDYGLFSTLPKDELYIFVKER